MNRRYVSIGASLVSGLLLAVAVLQAGAEAPGNEYFERTWGRTDRPVTDGQVSRTWMWGPEANTGVLLEDYVEGPNGQREVQYFDKSRMEITDPGADSGSIWYVTNGLLVVELVTGRMQVGHTAFIDRHPAAVPVAGDADDANGPTYATFGSLLDAAPLPTGSAITQRVDRAGNVTDDPALAAQELTAGYVDEVTNHAVAAPFWEFMNSTGTVYESGVFSENLLFQNPFFATGRPITEAYWADVKVAGTVQLVLAQCFERRCLTYTPGNDPGWRVEAGNVGQHYYTWRYEQESEPDPTPTPTSTETPPPDPGSPTPTPTTPMPPDPTSTPTMPVPPSPPPPPPGGTPPDAPTNLQAEGVLDGNVPLVELTWEDQSDNEDGFRIYWYPDANNELVASVGANVEAYDDRDGVPGQQRCYYVEAYNADGRSAPSNVACATVPEPLTAPALVSPPHGYVTSDRRIEFSWQLVHGAATYIVCAAEPGASCPDDTGAVYKSAPLGPAVSTYPLTIPVWMAPDGAVTGLNWTVAACDAGGECVWQQQFRSFTLNLGLDAPALVSPAHGFTTTDRRVEFSWESVPGAASYVICVAEPGASCPNETGVFYKSVPLGPTVTTHLLEIPIWLAPDNENNPGVQTVQLNWTVAACNIQGQCFWQSQFRSLMLNL